MKTLGRHVLVELWDAENLNSSDSVDAALRDAVEALDATLLDLRTVRFPVHGVTGVAVIAESHVAVHTWPEYGYAAVDVFTCNLEADLDAAIDAFRRHFLPGRVEVMEARRGILG